MTASRRLLSFAALLVAAAPALGAPPAPLQPLIRLHLIDSGCADFVVDFGAAYCRRAIFQERDITVFRDAKGLALLTNQENVDDGLGPLGAGPATAEVRRGTIPPGRMAALHAALASVKIGTNRGACNPRPFQQRFTFHYELVWYGQNFRHNVFSLSSQGPGICSPELRGLLQTLAEIGVSLPLAP